MARNVLVLVNLSVRSVLSEELAYIHYNQCIVLKTNFHDLLKGIRS